jgi:hypothetical protein
MTRKRHNWPRIRTRPLYFEWSDVLFQAIVLPRRRDDIRFLDEWGRWRRCGLTISDLLAAGAVKLSVSTQLQRGLAS